ncbi:hypothetical protein PPERSA_09977 [Pseudocohnilembus persalinus]|uniref:Uncharacterized protein n=1 Tax=Pseudocohnilembus persalinus TaxID=266149 RepID=A0A0V0QJQ5_PSEPJ|nr:hypothetical protein PPERSA_09977 [Pseudocohnilembus persalinus]|eukprot:KRX02360.1 hypothetical protein PPERSA_09977 [Pseudocohnilembus persalinus]
MNVLEDLNQIPPVNNFQDHFYVCTNSIYRQLQILNIKIDKKKYDKFFKVKNSAGRMLLFNEFKEYVQSDKLNQKFKEIQDFYFISQIKLENESFLENDAVNLKAVGLLEALIKFYKLSKRKRIYGEINIEKKQNNIPKVANLICALQTKQNYFKNRSQINDYEKQQQNVYLNQPKENINDKSSPEQNQYLSTDQLSTQIQSFTSNQKLNFNGRNISIINNERNQNMDKKVRYSNQSKNQSYLNSINISVISSQVFEEKDKLKQNNHENKDENYFEQNDNNISEIIDNQSKFSQLCKSIEEKLEDKINQNFDEIRKELGLKKRVFSKNKFQSQDMKEKIKQEFNPENINGVEELSCISYKPDITIISSNSSSFQENSSITNDISIQFNECQASLGNFSNYEIDSNQDNQSQTQIFNFGRSYTLNKTPKKIPQKNSQKTRNKSLQQTPKTSPKNVLVGKRSVQKLQELPEKNLEQSKPNSLKCKKRKPKENKINNIQNIKNIQKEADQEEQDDFKNNMKKNDISEKNLNIQNIYLGYKLYLKLAKLEDSDLIETQTNEQKQSEQGRLKRFWCPFLKQAKKQYNQDQINILLNQLYAYINFYFKRPYQQKKMHSYLDQQQKYTMKIKISKKDD